jgi:hypothetical protein
MEFRPRVFNVRRIIHANSKHSLKDWILASPRHIYVARNFCYYIGRPDLLPYVADLHKTISNLNAESKRLVRAARISNLFANPFLVKQELDRQNDLRKYKRYLRDSGRIRRIHILKGCHLACFCAPKPCHADILLRLANK